MKVKCSFCGNMINDTLTRCPDCGAPNENVRRVASGQPKTIEELKNWYRDRGLPEYKVTRFFIGENYQGARAFGIYYDEITSNYIVYKNKDTGERAIRYEGSDEAYAVNELYQRLKQEIIEQKSHKIDGSLAKRGKEGSNETIISSFLNLISPSKYSNPLTKFIMWIIDLFIVGLAFSVASFLVIMVMGIVIILVEPKEGYYVYNGGTYYRSGTSYDDCNWYPYDADKNTWCEGLKEGEYPEEFESKRSSKEYFIGEVWNSSMSCSDFTDSIYYKDIVKGENINTGYYRYDDDIYYHLTNDYEEGWYYYNSYDWVSVDNNELPEDFSHTSSIEDFYYTPDWDETTQYTDFEDTLLYENDKDNWTNNDSSDSDYDWDSGDSWSSDSTDWSSDW